MSGSGALLLFMVVEVIRRSLLPDRVCLNEEGIALGWELFGRRFKTSVTPWLELSHVTIRREDDSSKEFCFYISSGSARTPRLKETPLHPAFWQEQRGLQEERLLQIKSKEVVDLDGCDVLIDYINEYVPAAVISEPLRQLIDQLLGHHSSIRKEQESTWQSLGSKGECLPPDSRLVEWRYIISEHQTLIRTKSRQGKPAGHDSAWRVAQLLGRMDGAAPGSISDENISLPEICMSYRPFSLMKRIAQSYVRNPAWMQFLMAFLVVFAYCFSIPHTGLFVLENLLFLTLIVNHLTGPTHLSISDRALTLQCRLLCMRLWQIGLPWHHVFRAFLTRDKHGQATITLDHGLGYAKSRFLRLMAPGQSQALKRLSIHTSALAEHDERRNLLRALQIFLPQESLSEELSRLLEHTSSESARIPLSELDGKDHIVLKYKHQRSVSRRLIAFEKRRFAFLALTLPLSLAATTLAFLSASTTGYSAGSLLSWLPFDRNWLSIGQCWVLLVLGLLGPGIFLAIMNMVSPTHVVFGSEGIKLIWRRGAWSLASPLWSWANVISADFVRHKDLLGEIELFEIEGYSRLPLLQRLIFLLRMTPCSYMMSGRFRLSLQSDGIAYGEQRTKLLQSIAHFLPPEKIGANLLELVSPKNVASYTSIWLDALCAGSSRRASTEVLEPGTTLLDDRYRIIAAIGAGGQGTAYKSLALGSSSPWSQLNPTGCPSFDQDNTDLVLNERVVVLKEFILPTHGTSAAALKTLESIEREAALLRKLEHPNIVGLIDLFVEDQRAYLVLEHIDGLSLKRIVQENGPWQAERVIAIAIQLCEILEHLHSQDPPVIHRDFTPENIILANGDHAKLIDFNVAQQMQSNATKTVVGKHAYIPPEQFRGKASTQSDIYALGATLYFLLTGLDPEPITVSHPQKAILDLDPQLDQIVARATSTDTNIRYNDARQLKSALSELASKESSALC